MPISCGGVVVMPGDIVIGDVHGVVVVPRADAERVLELAAQLIGREAARIAEIQGGALYKGEIDETLRRHGVIE